jgi:signal transduction histidine kinase
MMPGLDGFELLRALRAHPRTRTLPVILLSARAGEESRLEGLEAGADDYLVKPFSSRELVARVGAHLAASRVRQEAAREGEELLAREREVRREAELASRAKDQFLAMLSHELRNPMGAISTAAHALQEIGTGDERRLAAIIARQSRHLTSLLDDLLDVARVTAGKIELRRQPVDLGDILERCLRTLEAGERMGRHNLEVRTEPAWVDGDPARLEQAITNLLGNAIKYTPDGGDIRVGLRREDGRAVLSVRDNGIGISPDVLPRIFDLFVQGERTLDRQEGGLGLGLTLVRQIVGLHGGVVEAWSEGGGQGSEFRVILPLYEGPRETAAEAREERARPAPRRVLIIEDNEDAREALRTLLELDGHQVEAAEDGRGGLELARDFVPDLVLLDIGLPGLDGYAVAQALASHPARSRMCVVAITGYGQESDRDRAREAGFDAHLIKPVEVDRLRELLTS